MIKLVYCMHRRPEYTHEQFLERWHVEHAPLLTAAVEATAREFELGSVDRSC